MALLIEMELLRYILLAKHGADSEKRDLRGWTCLVFAATGWKPNIVELLIKSGAEVNTIDFQRWSALTIAVRQFETSGEWQHE